MLKMNAEMLKYEFRQLCGYFTAMLTAIFVRCCIPSRLLTEKRCWL